MKIQGAVVREQGVDFAVVVVRPGVLTSPTQRSEAQRGFSGLFPGLPLILMAQDARGTPTYWGRPDIVKFLASVPMHAIPWREYSVN